MWWLIGICVVLVLLLVALIVWQKWVSRRATGQGQGQQQGNQAQVQAAPAAQAAAGGGALRGFGGWLGRNWLALVVISFFFLVVGPCCYEVVSIPRKIAQDGREFKQALSEVARKATSPAEKPTEKELKEEPGEPSPLSVMQMTDWWKKHGRPGRKDGWKLVGTEVDFHSPGFVGLEPIINTSFWEGYQLEIRPQYGFDEMGSTFPNTVDLVDSSNSDVHKARMATISFHPVERRKGVPIAREAGLVWLRTRSVLDDGSGKSLGFTVQIVEPRRNPDLMKRKQGSVRFAYCRDFRPVSGKGEVAPCVTLPFRMEEGLKEPVRVDFDLDVTLARLPQPGESTVKDPRPNALDLQMGAVKMELVCGKEVLDFTLGEWHTRLSSEDDIRPLLSDPDNCSHAKLRFTCGIPVGVHVAVQIGGTRR